jgi:two-component system invasion response regulator UvrY
MADDHTIVRESLAELIAKLGNFSVDIQAEDGLVLLEKLSAAGVLPDICILDINMPILDGYDTLKEIRIRWPELSVLILTMYTTSFGIIRMLQAGANGYLDKGCDPEELRNALLNICHKGYHYEHQVGRFMSQLASGMKLRTIPDLSAREIEIMILSCSNLSYKEIGAKMFLSESSICNYRDAIFSKLGINSRVELVIYALKNGLVHV